MSKPPHSFFARAYDLFMVPQERFGLRRQRARLCQTASGRVLEVAIGTGLNIAHYRKASTVIGVDYDRGMLRKAIPRTWEAATPVELVTADANALPFPEATFDSVVIALSLCTIPDPGAALEEFNRVAVPGAQLHFLEHVRSGNTSWAKMQDRFAPLWQRVSGGCRVGQPTGQIIDESSWSIDDLWKSDGGGLIQGTDTKV